MRMAYRRPDKTGGALSSTGAGTGHNGRWGLFECIGAATAKNIYIVT